jgi:hypothetical protein
MGNACRTSCASGQSRGLQATGHARTNAEAVQDDTRDTPRTRNRSGGPPPSSSPKAKSGSFEAPWGRHFKRRLTCARCFSDALRTLLIANARLRLLTRCLVRPLRRCPFSNLGLHLITDVADVVSVSVLTGASDPVAAISEVPPPDFFRLRPAQ